MGRKWCLNTYHLLSGPSPSCFGGVGIPNYMGGAAVLTIVRLPDFSRLTPHHQRKGARFRSYVGQRITCLAERSPDADRDGPTS